MNQVLQGRVYQLGNKKQAMFMAELAGMEGEVKEAFMLLHEGKKEREICHELGIEHDAYAIIEDMVHSKLLLAVFDCINYRMSTF